MTEFEKAVQTWQPGGAVQRSWPLTGGVSAQVTALDVLLPDGSAQQVVLRQYGQRDLKAKPDVGREEYALLHFLYAAGLTVPAPLAHAPEWLLIEFIEGTSGLESPPPDLVGPLAGFLARLHHLPHCAAALPVSRTLGPARGVRFGETPLETRIRSELARWTAPPGRTVLLHGDLWPGNTLWQGPKLTAVIDWEDAALGDPLYDVAITRLELLSFHGPAVMHAFTSEYARLTEADLTNLPYWDLRAALRAAGHVDDWGLSFEERHALQERHVWFVRQASRNE